MNNDLNAFLEKFSAMERTTGTMTTFQSLSQDEQKALLEWARATCMQIGVYLEKQSANKERGDSGTLPVLKFHADIALKLGIIHAIIWDNKELQTGCETAYRLVLGETKLKALDELKQNVKLILQLSRWQ